MRSRIYGRRLLTVAIAAATVTTMAVPASAQDAPPPAPKTYTEDDCVHALNVLSHFKLLPAQPDVGRILCSISRPLQQEQYTQEQYTQQPYTQPQPYTKELSSQYTTDSGQVREDLKILSLPIKWPLNLSLYVPTANDRWVMYSRNR
ncbi:hypothetical protein [Actinomadura pelletieri]|nr:hypothetical protein [Actinomadura pelletieri]